MPSELTTRVPSPRNGETNWVFAGAQLIVRRRERLATRTWRQKVAFFLVEDVAASRVARHQIQGELDALERGAPKRVRADEAASCPGQRIPPDERSGRQRARRSACEGSGL
jgi:hypothetical protein